MAEDLDFEINFFESLLEKGPGDTDIVEILGGLYTKTGRIDDGLRMDKKLVSLLPESPTAHYNLACSLALKKRESDAIKTLQKAVDLGYKDALWMNDDPDLTLIKGHPSFAKIISELKEKYQITDLGDDLPF